MEDTIRASVRGALIALAILVAGAHSTIQAAWNEVPLPSLSGDFVSYQTGYLSDGRFVYGTGSSLARQDTFGGSAISSYTNSQSWDPSFVTIFNDSLGAIGAGGFGGGSAIYTFDPSDLNTAFTPISGLSIQNYSAFFHDASSLLVGGNNGTGGAHSINYVTLDGLTNQILIDDISTFSGDFARDAAGNLFVSDNDDLNLYRFTAAQVDDAILNATALSITDGVLVTTLDKNGSIAVDSQGRIWSTGFQTNGLDLFDPSSGTTATFVPGFANTNYSVYTFSDGVTDYVGYLNAEGFFSGDALNFGYDADTNLVPEPSGIVLVALGLSLVVWRRRNR